jgi:dipeptidase E
MARRAALHLVLYSGGQSKSNHRLHLEVVRLAWQQRLRRGPRAEAGPLKLAYIPFEADGSTRYFARAMRRYRAAGIERFFTLEPDHKPTGDELAVLLSCDVIYLAGGNTYVFLEKLRQAGLLAHLRRFARNGGVLAGLSAGAILMTPSIGLAGIPRYDADSNEPGLTDLRALGLVDFEFSPHDTADARRRRELSAYSSLIRRPVFSVQDGGGIVVEGDRLGLFGRVRVFSRGECWRLT